MRAKEMYAVPLLLGCLLIAATAHSQLKKIYLQPKTTAREKQSNYVDSIRFIPLEVKDGVEVGSYYSIDVTDKYLLLVNYTDKRLIMYTRQGRFVKNISYKKLGPEFWPVYQKQDNQIRFFGGNKNYALTPKDRLQIELDWANPRNKKYYKKYIIDLADSSFSLQKATPDERDILGVNYYYDDYYLQGRIATSPLYKDSLDYELKLYRNNQLVKTYFPYNRVNEPRYSYTTGNVSFTKTDTPFVNMISRPYCDTIYKMVNDSLFPAYQLVLPLENSLPTSFYQTPFKTKTDRENFERNNGWMLRQVYSFNESPHSIFFTIGYLSNYDSYIYDKQKDVTYKTKNIKADSSQYNLDLLSGFSVQLKEGRCYVPLRASDVLPFFEKNKQAPIPKELQTFVNSKPPGNTPLIVEFKFKK